MEIVIEKIRNIRELKNLTQEHLADKLGITQAGYSKIEKGTTMLTYTKLRDIAVILGVKIEDILAFNNRGDFDSLTPAQMPDPAAAEVNERYLLYKLYEDKLTLYKSLLEKTETELKMYKDKYGPLL